MSRSSPTSTGLRPVAPRLIVVCGPGGAGKTTLADALSRALRIACLHKDSIKATLLDQLGLLTPRSYQVFQALIEEQLANGVDLVVDATFHGDDAPDLLRRWQTAYGVDLVCVICELGSEERRSRIEHRHRHAAHAEADAQQLRTLDVVADYSRLPGTHLRLTTDRPLDACVQEVLAVLATDRGAVDPGGRPVSAKAVVVRDGRVLLARNDRHEWELPGGRVEPGETPADAVVREVAEETGLLVETTSQLGVTPFEVVPGRFVLIAAFTCATTEERELVLSEEHEALRWQPLDRLADLPLPQVYRDFIATAVGG